MVAETEKIELQAFAFHHSLARYVVDDDFAEVGLPCFRAKCGKFRAVECDKIFVFGMLVGKSFKHSGIVIIILYRVAVAQPGYTLKFVVGS